MKLFTRTHVIATLALVFATAAGSALASVVPPAPPAPESSPPQTGMPSGPTDPISDALDKANLSAQQRAAVDEIGKQLAPTQKAVSDAHDALVAALADQIRKGKIDENALKDKIDALAKASADAARATAKSMDDLHSVLTPSQRVTFANAMENNIKQGGGALGGQPGGIDDLAKGLGLSDDQKHKVADILAKQPAPSAKERDTEIAGFEAFKKDDFKAEKVMPSDVEAQTRKDAQQMIATTKDIVAILTPDQRVAFADGLEGKQAGGMPGTPG